ncbi:hypothetical protein EVAR_32421_1 [Eumeta japonica]|uniref:Uncharacterized protein n=1 Tax=Eumeta variegata TaxID=151549 RepID=A0A4C1VMV9_EUMVA|nr:hypothetical protein EVAR_32421_1 [Eumeta japonica]
MGWPIRLQRRHGSLRPMRYHTLTECRRDVVALAVVFRLAKRNNISDKKEWTDGEETQLMERGVSHWNSKSLDGTGQRKLPTSRLYSVKVRHLTDRTDSFLRCS